MARKPLRPLIRSGGFYPSRKWTPLVYAGGYTTANGGEEPAPPPIEKTVTGNPIHILDALAKPAQALSVKLEPIQAGSGDPSPDNVRPISGHTDADVIVSPTLNPLDGTTYPIPLGQTVYGGTLDVVTGVLTVDRAYAVFDGSSGENWRMHGTIASWFYTDNAFTNVFTDASASNFSISNAYKQSPYSTVSNIENGKFAIGYSSGSAVLRTVFKDTRYTTVQEWTNAVATNHIQLCYKLATPQTIQLTPTQVELLQGENNLFSDGEMTLTYLADGNASDEEALNILLGGRHVNNHGEDEATDREALNIILGGNER